VNISAQCVDDSSRLGTTFRIQSCVYNDKERLWLVNALGTDRGLDVASEYVAYQSTKMSESNITLTFGQLMIDMGAYGKAEDYFDAILLSSKPNDEEIACIHYYIGRVYRLKGEYERALGSLERAYASHAEAQPVRPVSAAKVINAIGIVRMEQGHVQEAIESFERALKLYSKAIQEYHPDVGGTLINLGNAYCAQQRLDQALTCFRRAEHTFECNLPVNHPNMAMLLNNMGNLLYRQRQFDSALNHYQRASAIYQKTLPGNHPDVVRNKQNISMGHLALASQATDSVDIGSSHKGTPFNCVS
jgi:tetratricopeptide (TPR) repeat protein